MSSVRDGIEQAILISIGTASLTRERAEAAVAGLVHRGQITGDEGKKAVDRLMETVRSGGTPAAEIVNKLEGGLRSALRELGVVSRSEFEDLRQRCDELEHRLSLLESPGPDAPSPSADE